MVKKKVKSDVVNKRNVVLSVVVIVFLYIGFLLFQNRQQTLSLEQPVTSSYALSSALNNGVIRISDSNLGTIQVNNVYKSSKPITSFENNTFDIKSTNNNREQRDISLPQKTSVVVRADVGNGNAIVNARNILITSTDVNVGNGNITYTLPLNSPHASTLTVGNGNLAIQIPKDIQIDGIKINFENVPSVPELKLGKKFYKTKTGYETVGYKEGGKNDTINISGGNLNITIDTIE